MLVTSTFMVKQKDDIAYHFAYSTIIRYINKKKILGNNQSTTFTFDIDEGGIQATSLVNLDKGRDNHGCSHIHP